MLYNENQFDNLIGCGYYKDNKLIGKIIDIEPNKNGTFKLYLQKTKHTDIPREYVICDIEELTKLKEDYSIRTDRLEILNNHHIKHLYHFTTLDNLESILEYGLLSEKALNDMDIEHDISDPYRFDNKLDYISTSYNFPNYKMFFQKRNEDLSKKWVLIRMDKIITVHDLNTEFYYTNASNSIFRNDNIDHTSNESVEGLFYSNDEVKNLSGYTTDPQAEILVKSHISNLYINKIITDTSLSKAKSIVRNSNLDIECGTEKRLFKYREDWESWQ